jgi:hypothetical protein
MAKYARRLKLDQAAKVGGLVVVGVVLGVSLNWASTNDERIDGLTTVVGTLAAERDTYAEGLNEANDQLEDHGIEPIVPSASPSPVPDADDIDSDAISLSRTLVEDVVVDHLRRNPPEDGKTPSRSQIRAIAEDVIASFCAGGACEGEDGTDAEPVTQAQVETAVAVICAGDACDGDNGTPGVDGITPMLAIGSDGHLYATYGSDSPIDLGDVTGDDGAPGRPGADSTVPGPEGADAPRVTSIENHCDSDPPEIVFVFSDDTRLPLSGDGICRPPLIDP